jgi:hypothetical protein
VGGVWPVCEGDLVTRPPVIRKEGGPEAPGSTPSGRNSRTHLPLLLSQPVPLSVVASVCEAESETLRPEPPAFRGAGKDLRTEGLRHLPPSKSVMFADVATGCGPAPLSGEDWVAPSLRHFPYGLWHVEVRCGPGSGGTRDCPPPSAPLLAGGVANAWARWLQGGGEPKPLGFGSSGPHATARADFRSSADCSAANHHGAPKVKMQGSASAHLHSRAGGREPTSDWQRNSHHGRTAAIEGSPPNSPVHLRKRT